MMQIDPPGSRDPKDDWFLKWLNSRFDELGRNVQETKVEVRTTRENLEQDIKARIKELEEELRNKAGIMTEKLVYGLIALILTAIVGAGMSLLLSPKTENPMPKRVETPR